MAELKLDAAPSYGRLSDSCFLWAARPDLADPRKGTFKSKGPADKFKMAVSLASATLTLA